jgi:hypothetical protein
MLGTSQNNSKDSFASRGLIKTFTSAEKDPAECLPVIQHRSVLGQYAHAF